MINLLPPEAKKQIRAARVNVILRNYCFAIIGTALIITGAFGLGLWLTQNDKALADKDREANILAASQYEQTRKEAEAFTANLKTAKTILATNTSFSQLITDIATVVPKGVILSNLNLGANTANSPLEISARAKTYDKALELKNSLEASPVFENVYLTNVNNPATPPSGQIDPVAQNYPVMVTVSVLFTKQAAGATP